MQEKSLEVLTAREVAEILKIGPVKAYELLKTKEIASIRVGKRNVRTTRGALMDYIAAGLSSLR